MTTATTKQAQCTQETNGQFVMRCVESHNDLLAVARSAVIEYDLAKRCGFEPRMLVCLERTANLARAALAAAETP